MHHRHYPAVTLALAAALTILPVGLVLLLGERSDSVEDDATAAAWPDSLQELSTETPRSETASAPPELPREEDVTELTEATGTDAASEVVFPAPDASTPDDAPAVAEANPAPKHEPPLLSSLLQTIAGAVRPEDAAVADAPVVAPAATTGSPTVSEHGLPPVPGDLSRQTPPPALALMDSSRNAMGHSPAPAPPGSRSESDPVDDGTMMPMNGHDARRNRQDRRRSAEPAPPDAKQGMDPKHFLHNRSAQDDATGDLMEDVLLQSPDTQRPVGRIENLVASTTARGWPVALVKSDIPDDVWWVQQMVGIRGKSFAARVNFGNDDTLSGSQFQLVFVFLDSQEEVRRFRIAKQFKDVPEGVRHSRTFTFVRR